MAGYGIHAELIECKKRIVELEAALRNAQRPTAAPLPYTVFRRGSAPVRGWYWVFGPFDRPTPGEIRPKGRSRELHIEGADYDLAASWEEHPGMELYGPFQAPPKREDLPK